LFGLGQEQQPKLGVSLPWRKHWQAMLSDYVTGLAWSPDGKFLAAISAAGEVVVCDNFPEPSLKYLQGKTGRSMDCISISGDGKFVAAGGQEGKVKVWQFDAKEGELIATLEWGNWIDKLSWSPKENWLAFNVGSEAIVWDAGRKENLARLNFETSLKAIAWQPGGEYLAIGGNLGVKVWDRRDWHQSPYHLELPSASVAIAWSADGEFLAAGNLDNSVLVLPFSNPDSWSMLGFEGKVRQLAWSDRPTILGAPLLAIASAEQVTIWEKQFDESIGWEGWELSGHLDVVQAIAFQPQTFHLASAAEDGQLCIWHDAEQVRQMLPGAPDGFSCLAWHPKGEFLAAAGANGELLIWSQCNPNSKFARSSPN
jgi:WD40 repeat protein